MGKSRQTASLVSNEHITVDITHSRVGIGTTLPRFKLEVGSVGTSGTSLHVNGDARISGILTVGSSSITLDGNNNIIRVGTGVTINGSSIIINGKTVGSAEVVVSDTAPLNPVEGNLWYKSNEGRLKIYYEDEDSSQWVDTFIPLKGDSGTIQIGIVTTGETGVAASVTNSGTSSSAILNFTLPKGNTGTSASITIGTVTTGAPGSAATVINSGTSSSAILDFTIPSGADGGGLTASQAIAFSIALG